MMVHIDNIYIGATMSQDLEVFLVVYESKAQQKRHQIKHNLQVLESIFLPCDILGCQEDDGQHLRFCIRGKPSVSHATLILLQEQTCFVWYNHALELFWALCSLGCFNMWTANQMSVHKQARLLLRKNGQPYLEYE